MFLHQFIDVPIYADPMPFMANLFFYYYENKRMQGTKKEISVNPQLLVTFSDLLTT